jgi:riboflavin kinase/FMN adenylyltransferase
MQKKSTASVLTLGTFDGVHRGHQRILCRLVSRARRTGARSVVLAFGLPPRHAGLPAARPFLLTTLREKTQILKRMGADCVRALVFNRETASTSPADFFNETLVKKCGAKEIIVGPRAAFGRNRAGKLSFLKAIGRRSGVRVGVVPSVRVKGEIVASRRIRVMLDKGRVEKASALLGYPYSAAGCVVHGRHAGRLLGFPTANIRPDAFKILPHGVFWVKVLWKSDRVPLTAKDLRFAWDGICNVGTRPTINPHESHDHCEVFLFRKPGSLYGRRLRVVFLRRIRAEKRFSSLESLKRGISRDFALARRWAAKQVYIRRDNSI